MNDIYRALEASKKLNQSHKQNTPQAQSQSNQPEPTMPPQTTTAPSPKPAPQQPEAAPQTNPTIETVDVNIASTSLRLNCPSDEVDNLKAADTYINSKIHHLRQTSKKKLSDIELLALVSLELYDDMISLQNQMHAHNEEHHKSQILLSKIINDTHSIL